MQISTWIHSRPGDFATLLAAIATLATVIVLVWQMIESNRTRSGDFLLRIHNDFFFNKQIARMIQTIESGRPILLEQGGHHSREQLDDYLGFFELMWTLKKKHILDIKTINLMFGYYICKTRKNQHVTALYQRITK